MSVREDAIQLYGFASMAEYDLFLLLISVSGIGPKVGLGMLSGMPAESIMLAIYNGDVKALTKLPGIGKKSAERLVLELKDKINKLGSVSASDEVTPTAVAQRATGVAGETLAALLSLGYTEQEVAPEIERLDDGTKDVSQLLRAVLSSLGKGR
jgi:Holliday junction DNA helicase RuvA